MYTVESYPQLAEGSEIGNRDSEFERSVMRGQNNNRLPEAARVRVQERGTAFLPTAISGYRCRGRQPRVLPLIRRGLDFFWP